MPTKRSITSRPTNQAARRTLAVSVVCVGLPADEFEGFDGRTAVRVELQTKDGLAAGRRRPGSSADCEFATEIVAVLGPDAAWDFRGPAVFGKKGERFFYLSWSSRAAKAPGMREMFRRTKIHLRELRATDLRRAPETGARIEARVSALARDGGPACASVPLLDGGWRWSGARLD